MSKFSNRLLMLALLSAFAATSMGGAVAAEKHGGKDRSKESPRIGQQAKSESEQDDDKANMTAKTSVVTVTNSGASPLTITAAPTISRLSGNGAFEIVPPGTGTPCVESLEVPVGGECTIGVQYTPSDSETSTARLTLTDTGAATSTQEVLISSGN